MHGRCAVNVARTDFVGARMIRCGSGNLISELKNCFMCSRFDSVDLIVAVRMIWIERGRVRCRAHESSLCCARASARAAAACRPPQPSGPPAGLGPR